MFRRFFREIPAITRKLLGIWVRTRNESFTALGDTPIRTH